MGFPGGTCQRRRHKRCRFDLWVEKIPWRRKWQPAPVFLGFSGGSDDKESSCNAGDLGSIPGSGRFPRGGHGNPLQYSCMENPMDRGAWRATVHRVTRSWAWLKRLTCIHVIICYIQFYAFVLKCFCVCIKILLCFQKFFNFSGVYLLIRIWHNLSFLINIYRLLLHTRGFSDGSDGKEFACKAGDPGAIPGSGRSPREGNGNPLQ